MKNSILGGLRLDQKVSKGFRKWLKDKLVNLVKMVMQIFAESAESAKSARSIFATFATFASAIFVGKESDESTVMSRVKSRIGSRMLLSTLLMLTICIGNVWGTTETLNFAKWDWGFSTSAYEFGYFSADGYVVYGEDVKGQYYNSTYNGVQLNKNTSAFIQLPSIPGVISRIDVTAISGANTSAHLSLYVDGVIVGSAKTIGNTSASWTSLSITANSVVKLQNDDNSSGNITQIASVVITHNGSQVGGGSVPTGSYGIYTMAYPAGYGTASANVAYSESKETVTLTASPASGYEFDQWEISYNTSYSPTPAALDNYYWIDDDNDMICRFYMPAGKVTAVAHFKVATCTSRTLSFANASVTKQKRVDAAAKYQDYTLTAGMSGGDTWVSSNTSVATVDPSSGVITLVGAGATTISVTAAANGAYCAASGSYTLNVIEATATASPTSWDFGNVEVGETKTKTFTITTANLSGNLTVGMFEGDQGMSTTTTSIAQAATSTNVTVSFTPASTGAKYDVLTVSGGGIADLLIDINGTGVVMHDVHWMVNGSDWSLNPSAHGDPTTKVADGTKPAVMPTTPVAGTDGCGDKFMGWTTAEITGSQGDAPTPCWNSLTYFQNVTADVYYYAVFADEKP